MKLGVITDIHNNLTALKAVMARFDELNCDQIICCGDIIGIGPYPEQTVQYMMKIPNLIAVKGNHDKYIIEGMPTEFPNDEHMEQGEVEHHKWEHSLLSEKSVEFIKGLPYRVDLAVENRRISVMHYCMDENNRYVNYNPNPSEEQLSEMFADVDSDIILFGHAHNRTICTGEKQYINVGSLGCPEIDKNIARAGILTIAQDEFEISSIDVEYDVESVVAEIDRLSYPDAENIKKFFYGI